MRVVLVMPDDHSLWQPRRGLIRWLVARGVEVHTIGSSGQFVERLEGLGARHWDAPLDRDFNPLGDLKYSWVIWRLIRKIRPEIVHTFTTKPNLFASLAARAAGAPTVVSSVEGLGIALDPDASLRRRGIAVATTVLYRLACTVGDRVRFMNSDDHRHFLSRGIVRPDKAVLIVGEGVDPTEYRPDVVPREAARAFRDELGCTDDSVLVTMIARAIWKKGVREFVDAAKSVEARSVNFALVGGLGSGDDAVPEEYLRQAESPTFRWVGFVDDLREAIAASDVIVLPSFLREGVPNTLIEAMALGKPIITTDNVGCREVVDHGSNGFLIPVRDSEALASAIERLAGDAGMRQDFGRASRRIAVERFDERQVYARIWSELYRLDSPDPGAERPR